MKKFSCLLFIAILATSCKKDDTSGVEISIRNASGEHFKTLQINIEGQEFKFDNVVADKTENISVKQTYRYFYVKAITANDELVVQPIDFVGEKLIKSGKLAFDLKINTENNRRTLELKMK